MRILIVEDNAVSAKLAESLLVNAGHTTEWAPSGERALRAVSKDSPFDLILCDMGLPGLSGLEFVAEMRNLDSAAATPVIMCTATADPRVVESAIRVGCVGYLLKPLKPADLLARVESIAAAKRPTKKSGKKSARTSGKKSAKKPEKKSAA